METTDWRLLLKANTEKVYEFLNSNEGREMFWAEKATEKGGYIYFEFINGWKYKAQILERTAPRLFKIDYFNTEVTINLREHQSGTELHLVNGPIPKGEFHDFHAGWVSVLLAMKAAIDHGVDLRNHDPSRCWDQGFAEN